MYGIYQVADGILQTRLVGAFDVNLREVDDVEFLLVGYQCKYFVGIDELVDAIDPHARVAFLGDGAVERRLCFALL